MRLSLWLVLPLCWLTACSVTPPAPPAEPPLHQLRPVEVDALLGRLQQEQPLLRERVSQLARRFIGQPYELYLLGEFPFELHDPQPLFNLERSDCVVFVEHVYAMALSRDWAEFFWMLQRIRYRDGVIGVTTRNHYTEADWLPANRWLLTDLTEQLLPGAALPYSLQVDRERFFRDRYRLQVSLPVQRWDDRYLPHARTDEVLGQLQAGDFVAVVTGKGEGRWVSHVGLVVVGADGERRLLHSAAPQVREERFADFIASRQGKGLQGFKFLRLNEQAEPPPMAPQPRPQPLPRLPK